VTLASASLGSISAKEEEKKEEEGWEQPYLMVPVDLRKVKESNRFLLYSTLVDSRTTYNFISQAVVDSVGMQPAKARRQKKGIAKPPVIATVNGMSLHTTAIVRHMVRMWDSAGVKCCHVINFIVVDIASYNVILGIA
jgi:hypothetical protein